jgi:hypothetical protein
MFERLFGVSGTTHTGLDVIPGPAKCGIAHLDVQRDPTDRGKYEGRSMMVNAPITPRPWRTRLALQKEFYNGFLICLEHVFSL